MVRVSKAATEEEGWVGGGSVGAGEGSGGAVLTVGAVAAVVVALVPNIGDVSDTRLSRPNLLRE